MVTTAAITRSDLDLCLLGPLRVSIDGREVAVGGPRQMAVLARLMVTPGQVVSMEQLIASVWDGGEPNQPHVTVRSYVSNLRRAIEPNRRRRAADSCLASSPPGYRLAIDPSDVDWIRFQNLIEEARARSGRGDSQSAVTLLRRALSLWRGEPCSGLPASEIFEAHRVRLAGLRQTAVELLYESLLRQGQHDVVASEIEAAILADPLRERLTELGMLAFYRGGRQSEALAIGRQLRDRLRDGLGIDPSPAIEEMELRILNHDPTLERIPPGTGRDGPPATGPSWPPPATPGPVVTARGGAGSGPLVGRRWARARLASVARAVLDGRMGAAVVVGEQGIGKTAMVRELAVQAGSAGVEVHQAHGLADGAAPLWAWAQIALGLLDEPLPGSEGADGSWPPPGLGALGGLGRSVAALVGSDAAAGASVPTADVMLAMTALLRRRARRSPLLVVLEDLQWADRATVTLLEYAVSTLTGSPIGFVATWREPERSDGALASGLRSLSRLSEVVRIDLAPLDDAEVADLAAIVEHPLRPGEAAALRRRTNGNPLFAAELLTDRIGAIGDEPPSPGLRAVVLDRVERVHALAVQVLRAAALFRGPFTVEDLEPLHPAGPEGVERVIAAALRSQLLEQADRALGTYRFRHPIVREVLERDTVPSELRASHRIIGAHLLDTDEVEACYHLTWSPDPADRALAARIALDVFHRRARTVGLAELDSRIRNGLTAAETLRRSAGGSTWDDVVTGSLGFLSWRARVEDRPVDWADNARRSLKAAVEEVAALPNRPGAAPWQPPPSATPLRGGGSDRVGADPVDRLERSVGNLIGLPVLPAGPGDPAEYAIWSPSGLGELEAAAEHLEVDHPVRLAARIHLLAAEAGRPGRPGPATARREANRIVTDAARRAPGAGLGPVVTTFISRFGSTLDPEQLELLLGHVATNDPGPDTDLLWARHGYPMLLASGRTDAAAGRVEDALGSAEADGDPLRRAEARFLWSRHLLWIGALDRAERSIEETTAELAALGLAEPLPLTRQRRILRSLRGLPGDAIDLSSPDAPEPTVPVGLLADGRIGSAEGAFRLAHLDRGDRARDHLTRLTQPDRIAPLDLEDLALLAAAAGLLAHRDAARSLLPLLVGAGDRMIVRRDGSAIFGPASLWASFAARASGETDRARQLLLAGLDEAARCGGVIPSEFLFPGRRFEEVPIELQPKLKPAGAR